MPIDFSLIQPQPIGHVAGSIPVSNQPSPIDSLATGIMGGLKDAAALKANKESIATSQQLREQSAQLFPSQLSQSESKAQDAQIDLKMKQAAVIKAEQADAGFKESVQKGMQVLQQTNPERFSKLQADYDAHEKSIADTAKTIGETNKAQLAIADGLSIKGADAAQIADAAYQVALRKTNDPQQALASANRTYQMELKKLGPNLASALPKQYDEDMHMVLTVAGGLVAHRQMLDQAMKSIKTSPAQQVNIATSTDRLKETGKLANTATSTLSSIKQMENLSDQAFSGQGAETKLKMNQFLEFIGQTPEKGTNITEAFNSQLRNAQMNAQSLLKGSASDRDMEIVEQTGPQLKNTVNGRKLMLSSAGYKAKMDQQYNAFLNAYQNNNNGSLEGADEGWNKFVQSRDDFNPKTFKFDREKLNKDSWTPFLDPNYTPANVKKSEVSELAKGSIHIDANGVKAKYVGGDPKDVKSYEVIP